MPVLSLGQVYTERLIQILFAIVGLLIGASLGRHGGWFYGMLGGFAVGLWIKNNSRINQLQKDIAALKQRLDTQSGPEEKQPETEADVPEAAKTRHVVTKSILEPASVSAPPESVPVEEPRESPAADIKETATPIPPSRTTAAEQDKAAVEDKPAPPPLPIDIATQWLKEFFTTGNIMVKVGVTVLFFGIAFLVKYAAERNILPIELRLAGVALGGIVMLVIGWRLRETKTAYGLVLQGGALGVLYLTVFSALRLYSLLPPTLAFGILFVFAAFSAALAVLQNSRSLAVLGISGGFLAPILTSTGSGSHVALFSYYLVLNLGIFGIAWFRSWRMLNLVGFVFTFVVATAWGMKYYTPAYFSNTELFLIAFYLLYVGIAILFAFKQPVQLKGYVDGTLVFGVPLIGFGLQAGMVKHIEYALAWSSLTLAAFYIGLASILWRRMNPDSRLICEAFVALGVMFATLTVPFALDARWTAGTWALEGAAAIWIGSRQARLLPRLLGYILQFAGGIAYLASLQVPAKSELFILNGNYIGALIVALSGIFVAWRLMAQVDSTKSKGIGSHPLNSTERSLSTPFLTWGLIWWFAAGVREIDDLIVSTYEPLAMILFVTFSAGVAHWLKQRLVWPQLGFTALGLLPVLYGLLLFVLFENEHPFADWNLLSWSLAIAVHYWILKGYDEQQTRYTGWLHIAGFWLIVLLLTIEAAWQVDDVIRGADTWWIIMTGMVPTVFMMLMYRYGQIISWPVVRHQGKYQLTALLPMGIGVWIWFVLANLAIDGNSRPLNYIPFLNPLDLVLVMQLLALIYWQRMSLNIEDWGERRWRFENSQLLLALSVFLWLNTMWLRLAHHAWGIDFDVSDMTQSRLVQAGVAILWGVTGLSCMIFGARKHIRNIWIAGAVVMAAVVVKLFMFDLANTGTVERIVSFMTVGILLLVVGYFAPVPPAAIEERQHED